MIRTRRYLAAVLVLIGFIVMVGLADAQGKGKGKDKSQPQGQEQGKNQGKGQGQGKGKRHHLSGQQLLGDKLKTNGNHVFHQNGKYTASANIKNGKIAGINVKHSEKGDVPVTKYKTTKKMAMRTGAPNGMSLVSYRGMLAQSQYMGTVYIGYSYIDEYGEEYIYWFPYDMIYDGDTGAIEYVPVDY